MSLLEVTGLRTEIVTREATVRPVDGVTFSIGKGEILGLVGESGSGKTMTGMSIMGLLPGGGKITGGSIKFDGLELTALDSAGLRRLRGNDIALISQDPMTSLNPTRTIGSQLREAYRIHTGASYKAATSRATEVLGLVGMPRPAERLGDFPHQLSGGMRQRAMIAIGLLCEPKLLIADEPTTALDVSIQAQILELIDGLRSRLDMAVLLITHDMGVIAGYADRVAVMYAGRIVEQARTVPLFDDPKHRYTEALFESMPTMELDSQATLAVIPGAPPRLTGRLTGCRFAPRCRFAQDDCRAQDPDLREAAPGHLHACLHPKQAEVTERAEAVLRDRTAGGDSQDAPLLAVTDVSKEFRVRSRKLFQRPGALKAVTGVSLEVYEGETLGLVGESGCGKTTMGRMMVGLERPTAGQVMFGGQDIVAMHGSEFRRRRRDLQMMFQDSSAALDPRMPVAALVAEPLAAQHVGSRAERRAQVAELLDAVGLPADARPALRARVLRRPAAADRDGQGPRAPAEDHRRGRAGVRPRRVGPGADPQPYALPPGPLPADLRGDLARPVAAEVPGRPDRCDVPRAAGGAGHERGGLRRPAAPVHRRADRVDPAAGPGQRARQGLGQPGRRAAVGDQPPVRLPVPHQVPAGHRAVRGGDPGPDRVGRAARGGVPLPAEQPGGERPAGPGQLLA